MQYIHKSLHSPGRGAFIEKQHRRVKRRGGRLDGEGIHPVGRHALPDDGAGFPRAVGQQPFRVCDFALRNQLDFIQAVKTQVEHRRKQAAVGHGRRAQINFRVARGINRQTAAGMQQIDKLFLA